MHKKEKMNCKGVEQMCFVFIAQFLIIIFIDMRNNKHEIFNNKYRPSGKSKQIKRKTETETAKK